MNKKSKIILIIGLSLIFIACIILVFFELEELYSKKKSDNLMNRILEIQNNNQESDTIILEDTEYIGYLIIPTLELNLPISKTFSYSSLKKTPTLYYGSIENNNMVICGHSYKSHFKYLYKLKKGDEIIFVDTQKNKYVYKVELVEELKSTDIVKMIESDFDLTIYTCTKDGLKRVTVRCNRI